MLSGDAHTFERLRGYSLAEADKKIGELNHARVDEHKGRVTVWNQRGTLTSVPTVGEKVEKRSTEVVRCLLVMLA